MRVGPKQWNCVSTDSAGVPHGGPYGRVRWFEKMAKKAGIYIAWNRLMKWFIVYTKKGRKHICQLAMTNNDGSAKPFTAGLLYALTYAQDQFGRYTGETLLALVGKRKVEEEYQKKMAKQQYLHDRHMLDHIADSIGPRTKVISIPKVN